MGSASAPHTGICEEKAKLERSYIEAKAAFDAAQTAIRQKVGRSSRDEYLTLEGAADLAWNDLQHAMKKLASHIRKHGCGIIPEAAPAHKPIW